MIKNTLENFIEKAKKIHGDKYDYSKVEYVNNRTKVCIICPEHGEFWQTPNNHLMGKGCSKCKYAKISNSKRKNTNDFIQQSKAIHRNKYDYTKVNYKNANTEVCIICPEHGEFLQKPSVHIMGCGCPKCAKSGVKLTQEDFLNKSRIVHNNKYDYSKSYYQNSKTKICIICHEKDEFGNEHGEFWQEPHSHMSGKGCPKCAKKIVTEVDFLLRSSKIHNKKYDYSKVEFKNTFSKVCIICPEHGEFWQTPEKHMRGQGCPKCKKSKLENHIKQILNKYEIKYIQEKTFEWLKYNGPLRLDFYLPEFNIAIECQGKQHFFEGCTFSKNNPENLEIVQKRDEIKYNLCKKEGIDVLYYTNINVNNKNIIQNETKLITEILKHKNSPQ